MYILVAPHKFSFPRSSSSSHLSLSTADSILVILAVARGSSAHLTIC